MGAGKRSNTDYSLTRYVLFIKSNRTLPVGSESLAFTCSGLNFSFVWYRRFGFSLSMIFFTISATSLPLCTMFSSNAE